MYKVKHLVALLSVIAIPLTFAATAAANTVEVKQWPPRSYSEDTGIICGSGGSAFDIIDSGTAYRTDTSYFDNSGNFIRTIRHETKVGQLSNSLTGASVPYTEHGTITFEGDTMIARGEMNVTVAGMGVVWQDTGRFVDTFNPDGSETFVIDGPHDGFAYGFLGQTAVAQKLCAALGAT